MKAEIRVKKSILVDRYVHMYVGRYVRQLASVNAKFTFAFNYIPYLEFHVSLRERE